MAVHASTPDASSESRSTAVAHRRGAERLPRDHARPAVAAIPRTAVAIQADASAVVAAPLADWRDKLLATQVPVVSQVAGEVAGVVQGLLNSATGALLYQFRVGGSIGQLNIETVPTPVLTDAAAWVFEQMLEPRQVMRPRVR